MTAGLFGGIDPARFLFGENARHVPAWFYVQDGGAGLVTFVGASRVTEAVHPLRYGSERAHQLIVGELVVRPHHIVATDALRGTGLASLVRHPKSGGELLAGGELGELLIGKMLKL